MSEPRERPGCRLQQALDLIETGEAIMRQNLRRQHPEATDSEIARLLVTWLADRPSLADVPGFRRRGGGSP